MLLKSIFLFICLSCLSCTTIKYIKDNTNCLPNNPQWKMYFDTHSLRDLFIRVDSLIYKGVVKDKLENNVVSFEHYELVVRMNKELPGGVVYDPTRKPSYVAQDIQIILSISDTLDESVINNLRKENSNENIEKGYVEQNSFLYINNYEQTTTYILINLNNRRAYKLEQSEENLRTNNLSIGEFVRYGCYQGIRFVGKGGSFSFGDYLMNR